MLLYKSGLRISEAIGYPGRPQTRYTASDGTVKVKPERPLIPPLKRDHIDLALHNIRILETKSHEAQTRGFHPSVDDTLYRWIDVRKDLGFNGRQPFFCTLQGTPLHEQYIRALLGHLRERAGIEKRVHPHGLRRTFACELLFGGVTVLTISKLLGHSDIAVTQRYLDHLTNAEAIAQLVAFEWPEMEI